MEKFKLALAQISSEPGNLEANLKKMLGYIERAGREGARMIVFPEMCLPGYMVMDGPRRTGDGYYESVILDPDGNRVEITA